MNDTTRKLLIIIGIVVLIVLGLSTLAGGMMGAHMYTPQGLGDRRGWMWGFGMGLGGLTMLVFWGAVIAGIVLLVRQVGQGGSAASRETPIDVLKRRYAAGEITQEQYEQMKQDLEK